MKLKYDKPLSNFAFTFNLRRYSEATSFLLDVLKNDLAEQAGLQTKVLEINLVTFPNVADAILAQGKLSHYDRPRVAQLCEKAGLITGAQLSAQPKPSWSHLPVSPCLIDWGEMMHPNVSHKMCLR